MLCNQQIQVASEAACLAKSREIRGERSVGSKATSQEGLWGARLRAGYLQLSSAPVKLHSDQ